MPNHQPETLICHDTLKRTGARHKLFRLFELIEGATFSSAPDLGHDSLETHAETIQSKHPLCTLEGAQPLDTAVLFLDD